MKKLKIGLIGCGTIGSALALFLTKSFHKQAQLSYVADRKAEKAEELRRKLKAPVKIVSVEKLIALSDFVIEAASLTISGTVARSALQRGKQVLIMSVGGLLDLDFTKLSQVRKGKLWIPSGAIAGIDAVLAAREGSIDSVSLVTRKPPRGLDTAPYFQKRPFPKLSGDEEVRVFNGSACEALLAFPQNINVAAVLSLASLGAQKTRVEIWTSKKYQRNQHEVTVEGDFGKIQTITSNVPACENPRTSRLAILSAQATLRKIFSSVHLGT